MTAPIAFPDRTPGPFLSDVRLERLGAINARLLGEGTNWIHRRKEMVTVLDETALKRQITVDFTLPDEIDDLGMPSIKWPEGGDPVFCPPLFVLPKQPRNLMAFDVRDETGRALPLMTRADNGRLSAHTLIGLARRIVAPDELESDLVDDLDRIAASEAPNEARAERFLAPLPGDVGAETRRRLAQDPRFTWWLRTLSHSSIVGVPYRDVGVRRRVVKLSFLAPLVHQLPVASRVGVAPYNVVIDSAWAEGRTFHFEAEAPRGLRIAKAAIRDDEGGARAREPGFQRRVHLYRAPADTVGPSTATLQMRVSGHGFIGGALLATLLALGGLIACYNTRTQIAINPTSAPALLLLVPGLIASYVGRPDQHALTTRLLSTARVMLLVTAGVSYAAAATIALSGSAARGSGDLHDRVALLKWPLFGAGVVAAGCSAALLLAFVLGRPWLADVEVGRTPRRALNALTDRSFTLVEAVALRPVDMMDLLDAGQLQWLLGVRAEELLRPEPGSQRRIAARFRVVADRAFVCEVFAADEGCVVACSGQLLRVRVPLAASLSLRRDRRALAERLADLPERLGAPVPATRGGGGPTGGS